MRLPNTVTLQGEAHGSGPQGDLRLTTSWTLVSGPGPVTFSDPSAPVTHALFAAPGTYVLQLEASDGFLTTADRATITVDSEPSLATASLTIALGSPPPLTTGATETVTATLTDGLGAPITNFPLNLTIAGANPATATAITSATGVAMFSYTGTRPGADVVHATAFATATELDSTSVMVTWTEPSAGGPIVTQGWIASPAEQTQVMGQVPIVLSSDVTLTSGTLSYWPASAPAEMHTLATGLTSSPGATLATLDSTLLANGSYVVRLDAINDAGVERVSQVLVTVTGDYKPGRVVVELTDFTIPVAGLPITVGRRYDSLEKDNVGDFGHGWSLALGHPRLEVDPALNVTITMPDGRRSTFTFAPHYPAVGPILLGFLLQPAYAPEPGVFGTLTSDGCSVLSFDPYADNPTPICLENLTDPVHLAYAPSTYTYTDPYGRVFVMAATGELKSITDRQGNTLTFQPNGIISSAGTTLTFERDAQGRITKVISPGMGAFQSHIEYHYAYDGAGDLASVDLPPTDGSAVAHYTYDGAHRLLTTVDPRGNPARTSTYDTDGRLATDTDALGNVTRYAYDLGGRTTRATFPDTGVAVQTFDERGLLLSETDPLGHTTTNEYDANRNQTALVNAAHERTTFTYDAQGNQTSVTDSVGRTTRTVYGDFGNPTSAVDALGQTTTIEYDDRTLPTRMADALGTRFAFTSSEQGLPLTVDDAAGKRAYLNYDSAGNLTSRTDWLGRVTRTSYDEIGRRVSTTTARGGVTTYAYDPRGTMSSFTDPQGLVGWHRFDHDANDNLVNDYLPFAGRSTSYAYDALNHVTQTQYGDGTSRHYTRDFRGNVLTETDEAGRVTTNSYDLAGRLTKTTFPDATFTTRAYDALGRLASLTDERGHTTAYEYDPGCGCADRITKVTDPLGRATITAYDADGRRASITDAAGRRTAFVYDVRGHLIETDYPDGTATHEAYDARGRRTSMTDQTSAVTSYGYDDEGQLTSVTDALGNVTHYAYDDDGDLSAVTDANTHTTSYAYDLLKRKTGRTLPLGMSETFAYDPVGNQTAHTDFRGKTTTMAYDARDRLLNKVPDPSLGESTVTYAFNPTGTRASMTDASGATGYTYDARDRLLTKATTAGTLTYAYDASGNVATIRSSNANGTSVDYTWDEANQLVSVTDNRAGGVTTAAYTPTGRRSEATLPNGIDVTYSYDPLDRITSMAWKRGTSTPFASWDYTFSPRGQRLTATDVTGRKAAYGYDTSTRLTSETVTNDPRGPIGNGSIAYALDPTGNRLSRTSSLAAIPTSTSSYDANDQLTSDGYDPNGNTTTSDGNTYTYDFENRLRSKMPAGGGSAVTIVYDGDATAWRRPSAEIRLAS